MQTFSKLVHSESKEWLSDRINKSAKLFFASPYTPDDFKQEMKEVMEEVLQDLKDHTKTTDNKFDSPIEKAARLLLNFNDALLIYLEKSHAKERELAKTEGAYAVLTQNQRFEIAKVQDQ